MSAPTRRWTNGRWRHPTGAFTIHCMERVREIADELALLVAQEHKRANEEQAANTRLSTVLSFALAELECEREARERAEAEVRALTAMVLDQRRPLRFSHHARSRRAAAGL